MMNELGETVPEDAVGASPADGRPRPAPVSADLALRFYPLWSINAPLRRDRLIAQIRQFKADGMHGIVLHPRFYPGVPPFLSDAWLAEVSACIMEARRIGLAFWIYDENGWPSGTGDGQVLAQYPASHGLRLELTTAPTAETLGSFCTDHDNRIVPEGTPGATRHFMTPRRHRWINPLEPGVMGHFLELVLERYRTGLTPEAWAHVEAFFFDEPESGMIKAPRPAIAGVVWSQSFPRLLQVRLGSDYREKLPLLFARGDGHREVRAAFWELVSDRFVAGYLKPYRDWCRRHGKWLVGHVKGEESPLFQVPMVGSNHRILRHATMPGIDALERYPQNNFFPRQAGSVSRQFGPGGPGMVEAFGGAGWGATPADLERYILWLARAGLTEFVFHLCHYRLDSNGIGDWPPSLPRHMNWRDAFPAVLDKVRRELAARPNPVPDTLVVVPVRALMAEFEPWELAQTNLHNASTFPDTPASRINTAFLRLVEQLDQAGVAYDFTDERTLEEEGSFCDGRFKLGRAEYRHLLVDPAALLRGPAADWPAHRSPDALPPIAVGAEVRPALSCQEIALDWSLPVQPDNAWLLDTHSGPDPCVHTAVFETELGDAGGTYLRLWFADHVVEAVLDGRSLELQRRDEGSLANLPGLHDGGHVLAFRLKRPLRVNGRGRFRPCLWLEGGFLLRSRTGYGEGPNGTIRTHGPFVATTGRLTGGSEMVSAGYAFGHQPIRAEAAWVTDEPVRELRLAGGQGDALHVRVNGVEAGWTWGPDWHVVLPQPLPHGSHRLQVELIPSTYNRFGPHHYYNGDWRISTPGQAIGLRTATDPSDAPEFTHVLSWHFKPLRLPTGLRLLAGSGAGSGDGMSGKNHHVAGCKTTPVGVGQANGDGPPSMA